jgi:hypothetical protein
MIKSTNFIDIRKPTVSSGGGSVTQQTINIIEQNTGTQYNVKVMYTEIDWLNGVPVEVNKYDNSSKTNHIYNITLSWLDGVPTQIVINNLDDGIMTNVDLVWSNGVPISINKTEV